MTVERRLGGSEPGCGLRTSARWRRAAYSHKWGQPGLAWVGRVAWRRGLRLVQAAAEVQGQLAVAPGAVQPVQLLAERTAHPSGLVAVPSGGQQLRRDSGRREGCIGARGRAAVCGTPRERRQALLLLLLLLGGQYVLRPLLGSQVAH